ncbi:MAG: hypothetical protein Kow0031_06700 [Anaerolineae bacterium]
MEYFSGLLAWVKLNWMLLLFIAVIAGAFIFLRTPASNIDDATELTGVLYDGRPTVIEFYSNF